MTINAYTTPFPDFKNNEIINPDQFDANSLAIKQKFDEVIADVNAHEANTSDPHQSLQQAKDWAKSFGLGGDAKLLANGTDLNNLVETGFYRGMSLVNAPSADWFFIIHIRHDESWSKQIVHQFTGGKANHTYTRLKSGGTWLGWSENWDSVNVPSSDLYQKRTDISTAQDINWLYDNGVYKVYDGGSVHASFPQGIYPYGTLLVFKNGETKSQIYLSHSAGKMHWRTAYVADTSQSWTQWKSVVWEGQSVALGDVYSNGWVYADRFPGRANNDVLYVGLTAPCRFDTSGTSWRLGRDASNYIRQDSDGAFVMVMGGVNRHVFYNNGTKSGGTIIIDGENLGMSPVDSPQTLIEYVEFNVLLTPEGTRVDLDPKYVKAVEEYGVFPSKGEVVQENPDHFIIKGEGKAHCRIVGKRVEYADSFWHVLEEREGEM